MHTPGPWEVVYGQNGAAIEIRAPNDEGIPGAAGSVVRTNGIGIPASEIGKANARLIAAAPDLLAACKPVLEEGTERAEADIDHPTWNPEAHVELTLTIAELRAIRAAIARAEGRT